MSPFSRIYFFFEQRRQKKLLDLRRKEEELRKQNIDIARIINKACDQLRSSNKSLQLIDICEEAKKIDGADKYGSRLGLLILHGHMGLIRYRIDQYELEVRKMIEDLSDGSPNNSLHCSQNNN